MVQKEIEDNLKHMGIMHTHTDYSYFEYEILNILNELKFTWTSIFDNP